MLSDSITAFIDSDAEAARAIVDRDDEVDELYNQIYRELLDLHDGRPDRRSTGQPICSGRPTTSSGSPTG